MPLFVEHRRKLEDMASAHSGLGARSRAAINQVLDEHDRMRMALEEIAANSALPLEKKPNESLDATGAKILYDAWAGGLRKARLGLGQDL